ncbi:MAG: ABC transporter substrate-binding protein [Candidatus Niyogibacteria bacterium]|nr:ABC transporter substrate-binding protein [Candidatus Niyogibacteria bacterium]
MGFKPLLKVSALVVVLAAVLWFYYFSKPAEPYKITVGAVGNSPHALIYTAVSDLGIDKKYNLELSVKYSSPGEVERQARDREVDVGASSIFSVAQDNLKGSRLRIFGPLFYSPNVLVARKDSRFMSIEDLPGARLAVPPKVSAAFASLDLVARKKEISLESRTTMLFGNLAETANFLAKGEASVALFSWPDVANFLVSGEYRSIGGLNNLWEESVSRPFSFIGLTAYQDWIDANPEAARSLVAAIIETSSYFKENPETIIGYKEKLGLKSDAAVDLAKENMPRLLMDSWDDDDLEDIRFVISEMVKDGLLGAEPADDYLVKLR